MLGVRGGGGGGEGEVTGALADDAEGSGVGTIVEEELFAGGGQVEPPILRVESVNAVRCL